MKLKIINNLAEDSRQDREGYVRGILQATKNSIVVGWVPLSPFNVLICTKLRIPGLYDYVNMSRVYGFSYEELKNGLHFDNSIGLYRFIFESTPETIAIASSVMGNGQYPYLIEREYEALNNLGRFDDSHIVEQHETYALGDKLKYTFGVEFETSCGYIPCDRTFIDGLIPLRDGSISGIEYSTIVLEGNDGLNSLKQCMDDLAKYTAFNKECALHIHLGGFPVKQEYIIALANVQRKLEDSNYLLTLPEWSFNTELYKSNGKSYCKRTPIYESFDDLFYSITGNAFEGSLSKPHPRDPERTSKWNISSRYYGLNLVNMVCYEKPKTVEFRFLRPTDNFKKVYIWLAILNAQLEFTKKLVEEYKEAVPEDVNASFIFDYIDDLNFDLTTVLSNVYEGDFLDWLIDSLKLMKRVISVQINAGDRFGSLVSVEDKILGTDVL